MVVSARDVAAVIRERLPGVGVKKVHKLLYYCQGHHLATFGEPLFAETVSAWDMGPVIGELWFEEKQASGHAVIAGLGEAELNTIGYVLSRYGGLTGRDLETLSHAEEPWRRADAVRRPSGSARIEREWLREFFAGAPADDDDVVLDAQTVSSWLAAAGERRGAPTRVDDLEGLRSRLRRG
jgi:uncharacterized phage-associated protein